MDPFTLPSVGLLGGGQIHNLDGALSWQSLENLWSPDTYWPRYARLILFARNAEYGSSTDAARMEPLLERVNNGDPDDPVPGETYVLWQSLFYLYRYDHWVEGAMPNLFLAGTRIANEVRGRLLHMRAAVRARPYIANSTLAESWVEPCWDALWDIPRYPADEVRLRDVDYELGRLAYRATDADIEALLATGGQKECLVGVTFIAITRRRQFLRRVRSLLLDRPVGLPGQACCLALARIPCRESVDTLLDALALDQQQPLLLDPWSFDITCALDSVFMTQNYMQPGWEGTFERFEFLADEFADKDDETRAAWCSHFYARLQWAEAVERATRGSATA
ncbi:MAG TPA: DUF6000 family protein [Candidatus Dormibacteraeota bacterium]